MFDNPFTLNILYSLWGVFLGIISALVTYLIFSRLTKFNFRTELENGNLAVGMVVSGIFIMIGLIVGLIIGMSLN
jgi:uncharacterized membrane protein YjfL (UPF0719 family)